MDELIGQVRGGDDDGDSDVHLNVVKIAAIMPVDLLSWRKEEGI